MDLQGSTLLQSHTPCVALGKHLSTSANREWQLNAPWYAVSLGDNRPMRVGKCVDKTVVKVGLSRIPTGGMVCRIQPAALQKREVLSVCLEITPMSAISSFHLSC